MADPLCELLAPYLPAAQTKDATPKSEDSEFSAKYLSRLLSLRVSDLTTTEPQSLSQAHHSNHVSLQALSSRSHKTTIASVTHLSTLHSALPSISRSINEVREAVPSLDESAVTFASTYARSRDVENTTLQARKDSMLLARQSDKLTDILELPSLLSTAITSAGSGTVGSANYSQALDLFAHIKRLSIIYPDSRLVKSVQAEAEIAMKSMTTDLLTSLRSQNIRLASAIRTIGWLRRVVPELSSQYHAIPSSSTDKSTSGNLQSLIPMEQTNHEGSFGALFLVSRLHTFLSTTEALAPLRDLADQETERHLATATVSPSTNPQTGRRQSNTSSFHGTQTERYLKRYIEIFREQSFSTISMYRNVFPSSATESESQSGNEEEDMGPLALPPALQQFPLHLVEIFMDVLKTYLPNVTDSAARESLLMQVLYAANSLGRLGADFSMMISLLDEDTKSTDHGEADESESANKKEIEVDKDDTQTEPEWARIIQKHRVQAAKLDALASGKNEAVRRGSDIAVK